MGLIRVEDPSKELTCSFTVEDYAATSPPVLEFLRAVSLLSETFSVAYAADVSPFISSLLVTMTDGRTARYRFVDLTPGAERYTLAIDTSPWMESDTLKLPAIRRAVIALVAAGLVSLLWERK